MMLKMFWILGFQMEDSQPVKSMQIFQKSKKIPTSEALLVPSTSNKGYWTCIPQGCLSSSQVQSLENLKSIVERGKVIMAYKVFNLTKGSYYFYYESVNDQ